MNGCPTSSWFLLQPTPFFVLNHWRNHRPTEESMTSFGPNLKPWLLINLAYPLVESLDPARNSFHADVEQKQGHFATFYIGHFDAFILLAMRSRLLFPSPGSSAIPLPESQVDSFKSDRLKCHLSYNRRYKSRIGQSTKHKELMFWSGFKPLLSLSQL